jgi:hypothetical protein
LFGGKGGKGRKGGKGEGGGRCVWLFEKRKRQSVIPTAEPPPAC